MPDVAPFQGLRFDPARVDLSAVTSPPYDVISAGERAAFEAASPYNIVRLILGPIGDDDGAYRRVGSLLSEWTAEGVLVKDARPTMTVYEESVVAGEILRRHRGILAAVEMSADILPHERTMAPVVGDRLAVIRAARANLSPVFCLYWTGESQGADAIDVVTGRAPAADFHTEDGARHRSWTVEDAGFHDAIAKSLASARVVIADGHHRYRTAEAYRDERRADDGAGPWDRMLLYLVDAERDRPALLPIHRLVAGLPARDALDAMAPAFEIEPAQTTDAAELAASIAARRPGGRCFGVLASDGAWIATLRDEAAAREAVGEDHCEAWRDLDVAVLHRLVFDRLLAGPQVTFVHHPSEAADAIARGDASLALLLAATPLASVREVAEAHDSMPPKSTFFTPKPRTGIVIRPLDG